MKRKNLLSFLGIIACLLLAVPVYSADLRRSDTVEIKEDGKTINFRIKLVYLSGLHNESYAASVDLWETKCTNEICYSNLNKTSYIYYQEWDEKKQEWGSRVPVFYFGSTTYAFNLREILLGDENIIKDAKKGWLLLTKPADDDAKVGTFTMVNAIMSGYYETICWKWGMQGTNTYFNLYSRANGFTEHALSFDDYDGDGHSDIFMNVDWETPSCLAGRKIQVGFSLASYIYRVLQESDCRRVEGVAYDYGEFTRKVETQDMQVTFSPSPASYNGMKQVQMSCATPNIKIYYTLDGSEPTTSSTEYKKPILISQTTTIKVIALNNDNVQSSVQTATYTINPIEYVDFGLPSGTLWSTKNIGASNPEDFGNRYAWGEVEPKDDYTDANYRWGTQRNKNTKYQNDGRYRLEVQDDAASMNLGAQWHMPTKAQFEELKNNCKIEWTQISNVDGYLFTSKKDASKSIFIPAAGQLYNGEINTGNDTLQMVYLYTADVANMKKGYVWRFRGNNGDPFTLDASSYRAMGITVRPVMNPNQPATEYLWISGKANKTKYMVGDKFDVTGLEVNYLPIKSSAEKVTDSITWTVEPAVVYCGCTSVMVTASCKGLTTEPFKVTITNDGMPVDLGLSVQWSSFNLGSSSFTGYGKYYVWDNNLNNSIKTIFGNDWRLPTEAEVKELQDTTKCTWEWHPAGNDEYGGVAGYRIIGKSTGNFIFLPAAGCLSGSHMIGKGSTGNYWTSTTSGSNTYYMCFDMYDQCLGTDNLTNGRVIRAVKK